MTFFSFLTLLLLSIVFSLPIWSFLFCLILSGPKVSNTFILISIILSLFFNILDLIDLELEFFFFIFLFIYISAIVVLFLFALLILPINTNTQIISDRNLIKSSQSMYIESFELILVCAFWGIFENIDQLVENYLDLLLEYTSIKYSNIYVSNAASLDVNWLTVAQLNQNILIGNYLQYMQIHALSWFFLEKYFIVIIAVISILLTTIFGTIHWLRKTEVIEY